MVEGLLKAIVLNYYFELIEKILSMMFAVTPCFLKGHSKTMLLETDVILNATFNEHAQTIHERVYRRTDN